MNRTALIAAASFAAGYAARSELQRRRRPSPSGADKLRAAITADGRRAWLWSGLRKILAAAEPDYVAESITVRFSSLHGSEVYAQTERGHDRPELMFLSPRGVGGER